LSVLYQQLSSQMHG